MVLIPYHLFGSPLILALKSSVKHFCGISVMILKIGSDPGVAKLAWNQALARITQESGSQSSLCHRTNSSWAQLVSLSQNQKKTGGSLSLSRFHRFRLARVCPSSRETCSQNIENKPVYRRRSRHQAGTSLETWKRVFISQVISYCKTRLNSHEYLPVLVATIPGTKLPLTATCVCERNPQNWHFGTNNWVYNGYTSWIKPYY